MKQIPPNGCLFCELPEHIHYSRLDDLHPPMVWTWIEPSDKLRLQRMKRNRQIRTGVAMPETKLAMTYAEWLSCKIRYTGRNRNHLFGPHEYSVIDVREDKKAVAVLVRSKAEWVGTSSIVITDGPYKESTAMENEYKKVDDKEDFLDPHRETLNSLDAEIKLVEQRLASLREARRVVAGL